MIIPVLWLWGRHVDGLGLGDGSACGLGLRVDRIRLAGLALGCALAAAAVTSVGTVGFVGLLSPHVTRPLAGHRGVLPVAAMFGAALVTAADLVGRILFVPMEVPAGLVVALPGIHFFLSPLWRTRATAA